MRKTQQENFDMDEAIDQAVEAMEQPNASFVCVVVVNGRTHVISAVKGSLGTVIELIEGTHKAAVELADTVEKHHKENHHHDHKLGRRERNRLKRLFNFNKEEEL